MTLAANPDHPAKFSDSIMRRLDSTVCSERLRLRRDPLILDPFAGVGRVHSLDHSEQSVGVEIEPEWALCHARTIVGDATQLPGEWTRRFDLVITSPTYGNRMADHYTPQDGSKRKFYRLALGRDVSEGSSAKMQFGDDYKLLHLKAWREARRVLRRRGKLVLNISDHVRDGAVVPVTQWHVDALLSLGLRWEQKLEVPTPRMRFGQNHAARVEHESIIVMVKP